MIERRRHLSEPPSTWELDIPGSMLGSILPPLPNWKHELFALELSKGVDATQAYVNAGYKRNFGNASALKSKQKVQARLAELKGELTSSSKVTAESLVRELDEIRSLAVTAGQQSAAVQAVMGKAKILGLVIDRREQGDPGAFDTMTEDQLEAAAQKKAQHLNVVPLKRVNE